MRHAAGVLAAVPAVLAGLSVRDLAGVLVVVVIVVAAVCWVITDTGRTKRLTMLIKACRESGRPQPARAMPAAVRKRRAVCAAVAADSPRPPGPGASGTG